MKKKKIYCLAENAYKFDLFTDLSGGGERYLENFVSLLKDNNYEVFLYQFSYEKKTVNFRGHKITGLGNIPKIGSPLEGYKNGIDMFYEEAKNADGVFLLSMNLSAYTAKIPTITVSHGIMFNYCERADHLKPIESLERFKIWIRNATHTISVDTDTLHLMSVYCPQIINKMTYVPNYVDLNLFKPKPRIDDGKIRILYPRRLEHARGYHIAAESAENLLKKYDNMEFIFAGKGNQMETENLHKWIADKNNKVKHVFYEPNEMPKAYENIDIGIVPTCYAEGTSLSCLELLASNVVPIVTWVGGLSDLIQSGVNGIVIPPNNSEALSEAIEYCINNPEHVKEMRENGQRMIKHFSKKIWDERILNVVNKVYGGGTQ